MPKSSDQNWRKFGKVDPYYAVLSHEKYKSEIIDDASFEDFFHSGEEHISEVFLAIEKHIQVGFRPKSALDFGCGVGRLVIPLAKRSESVVGVDISPAMLEEARSNCAKKLINNASFVISDDELSGLNGQFDFIHSYIVLQHIPANRGLHIIRKMLDKLVTGGVGAIHITYHWQAPKYRRAINWLQKSIPGMSMLGNFVKGRRLDTPLMQMNNYNLNIIFSELQKKGVDGAYAIFTNHKGHNGIMILFKA